MRIPSTALLLVLTFLSCNPITERMEGYEVHGLDVSHHQSEITWDTVANQNIHFVFAKATEGQNFQDKHYCNNWEEMKRVGIKRGAYHFFRPRVPVHLQVENFKEQVGLEEGDLPPVLDVEVTDGVSSDELVEAIREWLLLIEIHYEVRPILYSNYRFYLDHLSNDFAEYPIWIARYSDRKPHLGRGNHWAFWQYGNRGQINGVDGDVDFNVFQGSLEDLESLCLPKERVFTFVQ